MKRYVCHYEDMFPLPVGEHEYTNVVLADEADEAIRELVGALKKEHDAASESFGNHEQWPPSICKVCAIIAKYEKEAE